MPVGLVILLVVSALVFFGVFQRVLDRMGLTDTTALIFIAAILIGSYLPDIPLGDNFAINIGGAIIPIALAIYLISKAGTWMERWRAIIASIVTAILVVGVMRLVPLEPTYGGIIDPTLLLGLIAGIVAYLAGRSRRSAFVAGIMGIVLSDLYTRLEVLAQGVRGTTIIGGAGIFDAVILSGVVAVLLAETVGEIRERIEGGPKKDRPVSLKKNLTQTEFGKELYVSVNEKAKLDKIKEDKEESESKARESDHHDE
ncbi:DUF1614 domain-containing protein [Natranaerofaba carboxydovora]|uniref:DUF1614 domain-containing protein n=1 Tax=Natranaerofaba carboxydovora TaxID=2742683 RepID=UPI001F141133|nr:DUF1614 domain-containing protein [Natranaerofaba carboxydovora]UMZ73890.1 hypothetical protein ACONDI_01460 [Natranaerofaba carboxydovora]